MVCCKNILKTKENPIRCRIDTGLGPVDLMYARYVNHTFAPHFHEGYCLGVIEKGALGFRYMGENVVAPAGAINLAIPGEVHTGQAADESGWTYRMFYLEADLLAKTAAQVSGKQTPLPFIRAGVLFDPKPSHPPFQTHRRHHTGALPQFCTRHARSVKIVSIPAPGPHHAYLAGRVKQF